MALPGRVPGGRVGDRLGDAGPGRQLPPRGGAAALGPAAGGGGGGLAVVAGAAGAGRGGCRGRGAAAPGGRLLPRDLEGEPGGAGLPGVARAPAPGGDRALPARLRQPDAGLPAAGEGGHRGGGDPRAAAEARHPARERARALQRLAGDPGLRRGRAASSRSTAARSRPGCARARRCISTCRARTAASSTCRPWPRRRS